MKKNDFWKEMAIKSLWLIIPLFISLMTWLVSMTYTTKANVEKIQTENTGQTDMINKVWNEMTKCAERTQNEQILIQRIEMQNETDHQNIMNRIKKVETKVDKVYRDLNYTQGPLKYPQKDSSFMWAKKNFTLNEHTN